MLDPRGASFLVDEFIRRARFAGVFEESPLTADEIDTPRVPLSWTSSGDGLAELDSVPVLDIPPATTVRYVAYFTAARGGVRIGFDRLPEPQIFTTAGLLAIDAWTTEVVNAGGVANGG